MKSDGAGRWHRTVAIATAICIGVAVALLFWDRLIALGFIGGVLTGAGMLSALVVVLNRVVVPPDERRTHPARWIALHVVKFALAAALAYIVVEVLRGDILSFAVGYTVALMVLLIVMLGRPTISDHLADTNEEASDHHRIDEAVD
jgi:hypothetical protein